MKIQFCHSLPHTPLVNDIAGSLLKARQIDIAVAFLTKYGVDFLEQQLASIKPKSWRLVVSIRWPTNLDAVAKLAEKYKNHVWIHLGGLTPQEKKANRYQLHSKLIWLTDDHRNVEIFVGSHNWTSFALKGGNIEAGVHICCNDNDAISQDAQLHIQSCIEESEQFDPSRLHYYKVIQAQLHESGPDKTELADDLEQFILYDRVVLLAEASAQDIDKLHELQLYFTLSPGSADSTIRYKGEIDLYLFAPGHLMSLNKSKSLPTCYSGTITMLNDGRQGPVRDRSVNTRIADCEKPIVELINVVPTSQDLQVIATLTKVGVKELPIFHNGNKPKLKYAIKYNTSTSPWMSEVEWENIRQYLTRDSFTSDQIFFQVPYNLTEQVEVNIPHPEFYTMDPYKKLLENSDELNRTYVQGRPEQKQAEWETKYFYKVTHREKDAK